MSTIALWSNIIAFAVMVSSIGLSVVIRSRKRQRRLDYYLIYAGCYALWTLLFSAAFFIQIYETVPREWFTGVQGSTGTSVPVSPRRANSMPSRAGSRSRM